MSWFRGARGVEVRLTVLAIILNRQRKIYSKRLTSDTNGIIKILPLKTAEEVVAREKERKARTTLLMALLEDHLAKFHKMADAKEMWEAIKSRFGGNDESKKMQKYLLKQHDDSKALVTTDDSKALVTIDGEDIDWPGHVEKDAQNYAMMAYSLSILGSDNESVFMNKASDLEDTPVNDRFADRMHAVPSLMTGNYIPSGPDLEIDYSKFTYGPKQTLADESDSKPSKYASCESVSSVETSTFMPEPVENASKVVCEPNVWTDAPIIEEYKLDSDNDSVSNDDPHRALKDKEVVDSGCSRHMTGNKSHLADYQEVKGGSVAFGGSNRRITDKGKIKTGKLDFEDVYYVEELKYYNLFSVSQMCDKKNKVLFTDTDCLVLSPDFKLPDENQVLLKIPRQHIMYSFNLKNIDPFRDLACLFTKASIDESNVTPPNWATAEYDVSGALLHRSIAQDMRTTSKRVV
uniref:Ribonuclease H-like domain-containing protein n=1 Tax=Tanacetum cinerariifolium TaxID=118510 RepID=A0A699J1D2_TANCI|nr:ribonuclease H-like domain-containing protein [Tanacetum cinerariifolium]